MAPKHLFDRYRELGAVLERKDGPLLIQPYASESEEDVAFLGVKYAEYPARVVGRGANRLEELRSIAAARGIPAVLLHDMPEGEGMGFADRLMTLTSSDETTDRYGDRILVFGTLPDKDGKIKKYGNGWQTDTYMAKNPVFMAFHQYTPAQSAYPFAGIPLGQALDTWQETDAKTGRNRLRKTVLWDNGESQPIAPKMMAAYQARNMRSFSVGFLPKKYYSPQDQEEREFLGLGQYGVIHGEQELLETSAVAIPANPNCTDEKMRAGARAFAADVREVAPELADEIEDAIPSETHPVSVTLTPTMLEVHAFDNISPGIARVLGIKARGVVPANVSTKLAPKGTAWSKPSLSDFTSKGWGELSADEKKGIAGHFGWAAKMPPDSFGDLKLPHHRASDGAVVFRGVAAAAGRLGSTQIPAGDKAKVRSHLGAHYKAFGETAPWDAKSVEEALERMAECIRIAEEDGYDLDHGYDLDANIKLAYGEERGHNNPQNLCTNCKSAKLKCRDCGAKQKKPMAPADGDEKGMALPRCQKCGGQNLTCMECDYEHEGDKGEPQKALRALSELRDAPDAADALEDALELIQESAEAIEDLLGVQEEDEDASTLPAPDVVTALNRIDMGIQAIAALAQGDGDGGDEEDDTIDSTKPTYPGLSAAVDARVLLTLAKRGIVATVDPGEGSSGALGRLMEETREALGETSANPHGAAGSKAEGQGSQEDDPYREKLLEDVMTDLRELSESLDRA